MQHNMCALKRLIPRKELYAKLLNIVFGFSRPIHGVSQVAVPLVGAHLFLSIFPRPTPSQGGFWMSLE